MNISEHTKNFVQEMGRRNYRPNTIENYSSCIKVFFEKSTKDHPKNINEQDIKDFLYTYCKPNTQRNYHSAIKLFYEICMKQKNKFKYIPYARKEQKLPIVLSQDEIQAMFKVCENMKHKAILALLYSAGLRVSELINLKWEHLDRGRKVINILDAKGGKDRQVPFADEVIELLEKYYFAYHSKVYVFNGQTKPQYTDRSVLQVVKKLATKAGILKKVWTHLMRHCSFTHMLENGTDLKLISDIAGHSSLKTTEIYTHLSHNIISRVPSPIRGMCMA